MSLLLWWKLHKKTQYDTHSTFSLQHNSIFFAGLCVCVYLHISIYMYLVESIYHLCASFLLKLHFSHQRFFFLGCLVFGCCCFPGGRSPILISWCLFCCQSQRNKINHKTHSIKHKIILKVALVGATARISTERPQLSNGATEGASASCQKDFWYWRFLVLMFLTLRGPGLLMFLILKVPGGKGSLH